MLNASTELRTVVAGGTWPLVKAQIVFATGERMDLEGGDFMSDTLSFTQATSSSGSFDIGAAIVGSFSCKLNNYDRKFDDCDFTGARIIPQVGIELEGGDVEWVRKGTYWIDQPESYGETISLDCADSMSKFDVPYSDVGTRYPATAATVVADICEHCGIPLLYAGFANSSASFKARPDGGATCRDVLSWAAQATGNYARVTFDDRLEVSWYDRSLFDSEDWLDGEEFDGGSPYQSGSDADGGNFTDYTSGYVADGGSFSNGDIANIYSYASASVFTDDVEVTGIRVTASDELLADGTKGRDGETALFGSDGYVLEVSGNPLVSYGEAAAAARRIASQCVGLVFRPFDTSCSASPCYEAGDCAVITDMYQNSHKSFITRITYKVGARASIACTAETPLRNGSSGSGAITRAILGLGSQVKAEKTAREAAIKRLNDDLENSAGMYTTTKVEGGASTWYIHDKKSMSDSKFVWKVNSAGFGMSINGGKTYQYGLDKWGSAILNTIYAVGIDADYIKTGSLRVRRGSKTIFCADVSAGQFWWDSTYSKLTNMGELTVTSGKVGGFSISASAISNGIMRLDQSGLKLGSLMTLNSTGVHLASAKGNIGHIETNGFYGHPQWNGILFNLSYDDGWYIAWACQKVRGSRPVAVMLYSNTSDSFYAKDQIHLGCDFNMHWFKVRDASIENSYIESNTWYRNGFNGSLTMYHATGFKPGTWTLQLAETKITVAHGFITGMTSRNYN